MSLVIVTVFRDCGKFIDECFRSVIEQTSPNWTYLVHDDGSRDDGGETVRRLRDGLSDQVKNRVSFSSSSLPLGKSRSIKFLEGFMAGDYLMFLDGDDFLEKEAVQHIENLFAKTNLEVVKAGTFFIRANARGFFAGNREKYSPELLHRGRFPSGGYAFRLPAYFEAGGIHDEFSLGQSFELALRMARRRPFLFDPTPIYNYRIHPDQVTHKRRSELGFYLNLAREIHPVRTLARVE
jgi:glycosyltransferase involved in cell wall biosynthesis